MSQIKDLFLQNKELRNWWASVVEDARFKTVCVYIRAEVLEHVNRPEDITGARAYERALTGICEAEERANDVPTPGLHHFADSMPAETTKQITEKK